jgi:tryptophan synthase beta chain
MHGSIDSGTRKPIDSETRKYILTEKEMPGTWYNVVPDVRFDLAPPLHPGTMEPLRPEDLTPLFPMALIEQEVSTQRYIDIPGEVLDVLRLWRPSPLFRARNLEKALGTSSRIYYKYEGASPAGSHKPNTAVPQAFYNKKEGMRRLSTETGAGQWGTALSLACALFGLDCTVYMVRVSYEQKPYRRSLIRAYGAEILPSPSDRTAAGRAVLARDPESRGSLGLAISEAVEDAVSRADTHYALGSVLNHVLLHQTVIGEEAILQMALADDYPDYVVGCHGGGSNFGGLAIPFLRARLEAARRAGGATIARAGAASPGAAGKAATGPRLIAAEPAACPTLTRGRLAYDYGDTAGVAPVTRMYTLGHGFMPEGIHAGGLRYHGASPLVSALVEAGLVEARAIQQLAAFEAAALFARTEGILPAPESAHAIRAAVDIAREEAAAGRSKAILFNLSGHGHFDLAAYDDYFAGRLTDHEHPQERIDEALRDLPLGAPSPGAPSPGAPSPGPAGGAGGRGR